MFVIFHDIAVHIITFKLIKIAAIKLEGGVEDVVKLSTKLEAHID